MRKETIARVIPFAAFMVVIGIGEIVSLLSEHMQSIFVQWNVNYLYPVRVIVAGALLWFFRAQYVEIKFLDLRRIWQTLVCFFLGVLVFFVWISLDMSYTLTPSLASGYDPALFPEGGIRSAMVCVRIIGAVLVVPIMEELFWRSFLLRYLIKSPFYEVKIGSFTIFSFVVTAVLFGMEHNMILAGIFAGIVYNAILIYTKSISQCILSHATTNALLACYVLATGNWRLW